MFIDAIHENAHRPIFLSDTAPRKNRSEIRFFLSNCFSTHDPIVYRIQKSDLPYDFYRSVFDVHDPTIGVNVLRTSL